MSTHLSDENDDTDFHLPKELSWTLIKQWFKAVYSRLTGLKECLGNDASDIVHPNNFWAHNSACQEYVHQLQKVQREVEAAIELARGTYFDKDSIKVKKSNDRFLRFKPYNEYFFATSSDSRDRTPPGSEENSAGRVDTPQPEGGRDAETLC